MIGCAGQWTRTPATMLSSQKIKCSFLDCIHFWWSTRLVDELEPSATPLQPKKWNAHFLITFNFWWSAGLLDGLEPGPPPISSLKIEMLIFWLCSLLMIGCAGQWTRTPATTALQPKNKMLIFSWWTWTSHLPLLSSQKNEMLIFWLRSTSDDQLGWSMDLNPICQPSPAIKWNASFWIMFTSDDQPGWSMDSNPIHHPSPANKMKYSFLDYVQLLMISWAGR